MKKHLLKLSQLALMMGFGVTIAATLARPAHAVSIRDDTPLAAYQGLAASSAYDSVGFIVGASNAGGYSGSGTLIAPHWILTAGHVVDSANELSLDIGGQSFGPASGRGTNSGAATSSMVLTTG